MRTSLLAAILAASALVPAAAIAQDNPDRPQRGDHQDRGQQHGQQPQQQRQPIPGAEGRTQWQRPQGQQGQGQRPQQAQPQPQQQAQPQQQQRPDRGQNQGGRPNFGDGRGNPNGGQFQGRPQDRGNGRPDAYQGQRGGDPRGNDRGYQPNGRGQDFRGNDGRGPDFRGNDGRGNDGRGGYNGGYNRGGNQGWSRDWRRDNRYNYNAYRSQNRGAYHLPRYYAPSGWGYGYRRFSIGFSLSSILYNQDYWIDDPIYYRLPPAYGPYRWVRYYNDALLVDIRTGYVVDTVYDIFW